MQLSPAEKIQFLQLLNTHLTYGCYAIYVCPRVFTGISVRFSISESAINYITSVLKNKEMKVMCTNESIIIEIDCNSEYRYTKDAFLNLIRETLVKEYSAQTYPSEQSSGASHEELSSSFASPRVNTPFSGIALSGTIAHNEEPDFPNLIQGDVQ